MADKETKILEFFFYNYVVRITNKWHIAKILTMEKIIIIIL